MTASSNSSQSAITTTTTPYTSLDTLPQSPARSLSFKYFSSLVRTPSGRPARTALSTKHQESARATDPSIVGVLADYTNGTMFTSRENAAIPRKTENKLYNFFRTRSRSRSKARRSQSAEPSPLPGPSSSPVPPLPTSAQHTRHSSLGDYGNRTPPTLSISTGPSNASSKPVTRSQSRPLSTMTTGTHSTITSLVTPTQTRGKGKKHGGTGSSGGGAGRSVRPASTSSSVDFDLDTRPTTEASISAFSSSSPPPFHRPSPTPPDPPSTSSSLSAAASKQPTSTRIRLHNLFGIPLTNSRRSSFGAKSNSNTNTPVSSAPNLPSTSLRPTPPQALPSKYTDLISPPQIRPRSAHRRATSPNPSSSKDSGGEKEKRRSATAPASWLTPRFFSGSGSTLDHREPDDPAYSPPPLPSTMLIAVNGDSTSTLQTTHSSNGDRGISSSIHAPHPQSRSEPIPPVPKIMHMPPMPQKMVAADSRNKHRRSGTGAVAGGGGKEHGRNRSLAVHGEERLSAGGEENEQEIEEKEKEPKKGRWSPRFFSGGDGNRDKGKEKQQDRLSRVISPVDTLGNGNAPGLSRTASRNSRSKHGSFIFEGSRPLSGVSSSGGTTVGVRAGKATSGASSPPVAIAHTMSRERSKDGKLERTVSFSQSQSHSKHSSRDRPSSTSPRTYRRGLPDGSTSISNNHHHTNPSAHPSANKKPIPSSTVPGPVPVGLSSSWGPATTIATTNTTKSTSTGAAAPGNGGNSSMNGKRRAVGLAHGSFAFEPAVPPPSSPAASEFGVIRSGDSGYQESAASASTNGGVGGGRRGKGRSLDLNIGLSWAPTKVKPEAVMPSFLEMNGGSLKRDRDREEEKRRFESGVSDVFRNVLGEGGFATFKKYIRRFDAQLIPFDGPSGLITGVEKLLNSAPPPGLDEREKRELLDRFIQVVLQNTG